MATHNELARLEQRGELEAALAVAREAVEHADRAARELGFADPVEFYRNSSATNMQYLEAAFRSIFAPFVAWIDAEPATRGQRWDGEGMTWLHSNRAPLLLIMERREDIYTRALSVFAAGDMTEFTQKEKLHPQMKMAQAFWQTKRGWQAATRKIETVQRELGTNIPIIARIVAGITIVPSNVGGRALYAFMDRALRPERMSCVLVACSNEPETDGYFAFIRATADHLGPDIPASAIVVVHTRSKRLEDTKGVTGAKIDSHVAENIPAILRDDGSYILRDTSGVQLSELVDKAAASTADELFRWISARLRTCMICRRGLRDATSVERGIGPVCAATWCSWV